MNGGGGYASYQQQDAFAQIFDNPLLQQQLAQNNPCSVDYNPRNGDMQTAASLQYNPAMQHAAAALSPANNIHQHHNLLMSVGGFSNNSGLSLHVQQQAPAVNMNYGNAAAALRPTVIDLNHVDSFAGGAFDPLPFSAPAPQPQQAHHHRQHSFEDFLMAAAAAYPMNNSFQISAAPVSATSSNSNFSDEPWLEEISIEVPGLSLEPLSGSELVKRARLGCDDVLTRYIPCVDFLVQCQQELRKGLNDVQKLRAIGGRRGHVQPRQFYMTYIHPLPQRFQIKNQFIMPAEALGEALNGVHQLTRDAQTAERHGCEAIKNQFLGGMKDGESWGLRKWLSKHGNAGRVCTDIECIMQGVRKLDKKAESTRKLAAILRPVADNALKRLKKDIPQSYQEHSTAHPYLPFFHRLEAALRSMSTFDPDDDGVICLDDSDDDEPASAPPPRKRAPAASTRKRKGGENMSLTNKRFTAACTIQSPPPEPKKAPEQAQLNDDSSSGDSDDGSLVEIVAILNGDKDKQQDSKIQGRQEWKCSGCSAVNIGNSDKCTKCGETDYLKDFAYFTALDDLNGVGSAFDSSSDQASAHAAAPPQWPLPVAEDQLRISADNLAASLDKLAYFFDQNQQGLIRPSQAPFGNFWDGERYAGALRLFASLLRRPESPFFVDRIDEDQLIQAGNPPYSHIIKHPLCFRDIVAALISDVEWSEDFQGQDGNLPVRGLSSWNMWKGMDLLQAIDLVFLNTLAYGKAVDEGRSTHRAKTNKLRKSFWDGITNIVSSHVGSDNEQRKLCTPTRRSESSGFVVYKIR